MYDGSTGTGVNTAMTTPGHCDSHLWNVYESLDFRVAQHPSECTDVVNVDVLYVDAAFVALLAQALERNSERKHPAAPKTRDARPRAAPFVFAEPDDAQFRARARSVRRHALPLS